jgi:poly-gamma-glutamate capsule biosynthesis protein CapA/YwtB (metallophosphatase superfamily)
LTYLGAGQTRAEALGPVFLDVPMASEDCRPIFADASTPRSTNYLRVGLLSASDHPREWSTVPSFHLLPRDDLSTQLAPLIAAARAHADLVIFSVHWGPNYQWIPDAKIIELAHWLIDQGVDIIHGHSSHHIQGVEIVPRAHRTPGLIIYGCGDFVDDYAINEQFRNDLSALFRVNLLVNSKESKSIELQSLSVFPTRCANFQVNRLKRDESDWYWIKEKLIELSDVKGRTWRVEDENEIRLQISL